MGYSFWLAARVLLYAPSHRQDNTYHSLSFTPVMDLWLEQEIAQWVHYEWPMWWPIAPWAEYSEIYLWLNLLVYFMGTTRARHNGYKKTYISNKFAALNNFLIFYIMSLISTKKTFIFITLLLLTFFFFYFFFLTHWTKIEVKIASCNFSSSWC